MGDLLASLEPQDHTCCSDVSAFRAGSDSSGAGTSNRHRTSSVAEEMKDHVDVEREGCGEVVEVWVASACQREGTRGSPCLADGSVLPS